MAMTRAEWEEAMDHPDCRPLKSFDALEAMGMQVPEHVRRMIDERKAAASSKRARRPDSDN